MNSAPARKGVSSFLTAGSFLLLLTFPRYSKSGGLTDPLIRASYCLLGQSSIGRVPVLVLLLPLPPLSGQEVRWPQTARVIDPLQRKSNAFPGTPSALSPLNQSGWR